MQRLGKLKAEGLASALHAMLKEETKAQIDKQVKVKAEGLYDALANTVADVKAETLAKL